MATGHFREQPMSISDRHSDGKATDGGGTRLQFHPIANCFPLIEGREFAAFVEDVRANGLLEPIVLYEGMILEGRNRFRACSAAGVASRFEQYAGDDPIGFVVSASICGAATSSESQRAHGGREACHDEAGRAHRPFANWRNVPSESRRASERRQAQRRARG